MRGRRAASGVLDIKLGLQPLSSGLTAPLTANLRIPSQARAACDRLVECVGFTFFYNQTLSGPYDPTKVVFTFLKGPLFYFTRESGDRAMMMVVFVPAFPQ